MNKAGKDWEVEFYLRLERQVLFLLVSKCKSDPGKATNHDEMAPESNTEISTVWKYREIRPACAMFDPRILVKI